VVVPRLGVRYDTDIVVDGEIDEVAETLRLRLGAFVDGRRESERRDPLCELDRSSLYER